MKKLITIILAFFYLASTAGVTLNHHYCGGKLASVNIVFLDTEHKCGCGSKKMKKGCCKNKTQYLKVNAHQKNNNSIAVPTIKKIEDFFFSLVPNSNTISSAFLNKSKFREAYSTPVVSENPVYLLNQVFRI